MAAQDRIEAIHTAAMDGDAGAVTRMLDEDPVLLSSEWDGETLLTHAARGGHAGVATLLLERGADVNTPNDRGNTALLLAAGFGHEEVVSILLGSGADVFRRGAADWTVLMCGSYSGSVAVVRLLLQAMGRRGLDARSESGYTALWYACFGGHVIILRALLLAGADRTIANNAGTTPQRIAQIAGSPESVDVIQVNTVVIVTSITCTVSRYSSLLCRCCWRTHIHGSLMLVWCSGGRASCSVPMSSTRPGRYTKTPPRASKPLQPQCPPTWAHGCKGAVSCLRWK
jgi:ankyrin repeat protein